MKILITCFTALLGFHIFAFQCSNGCWYNDSPVIEAYSLAVFNDQRNCTFDVIATVQCKFANCSLATSAGVYDWEGRRFALDYDSCFSCQLEMSWATAVNPNPGLSAYLWGRGGHAASTSAINPDNEQCQTCRNKPFSCQQTIGIDCPDGDGGTGCPQIYPNCKTKSAIDPCPNTPLVIDLGQDGFHFGPANRFVPFDMRGSGTPLYLQWVARQTNDAFLFQDRNKNGIADNGTELFGSGTKLTASNEWAPNGFVALAQYDRPENGGNDDSLITPKDSLWNSLFLWLDLDANGICHRKEVFPLQKFGILALDTIPQSRVERDLANNLLPLWSKAIYDLESGKGYEMVDVFFRYRPEKNLSQLRVRERQNRKPNP